MLLSQGQNDIFFGLRHFLFPPIQGSTSSQFTGKKQAVWTAPKEKKEELVLQDCYIVVIGQRICLYTDSNLWYYSFVKVYWELHLL